MEIAWNETLATGNTEIDNQHKELFARFASLLTACNNRKGKEEVLPLLAFLGDYVRTHFGMEERLQQEHAYPHYREHKEQHEGFIRDLHNLERQLRDDGSTLSLLVQTNQTMANWLINHINIVDRQLAAFLRERG